MSLGKIWLVLCLPLGMMCTFMVGTYTFATQLSGEKDRAAIQSVIKAFVSAWNHDDADAFVKLFTPDGEMKSPSREVAKSRAGIRTLVTKERKELFRESTLKKDVRRISFDSLKQAIVEGEYELSGIEPGVGLVDVSITGDFKVYLEKTGDTWLITKCDIRESE